MNAATAAAAALGRSLGLAVDRAEPLAERSNAIVALEPAGVVARVATITVEAGRDVVAALRREIAVAARLEAAGAPAVGPIEHVHPGPHEYAGFVMTLWPRLHAARPAAPRAAGLALRRCHAALAGSDQPALWLLTEAARLAEDDRVRPILGPDRERIVRALEEAHARLAPMELVAAHGDAGLGNALEVAGRTVWIDWEDTMLAPRLWDAACLAATPAVFGDEQRASEALAGLGIEAHDPELRELMVVRVAQIVPWSALAVALGSGRRERLEQRLAWLRAR